MRRAGVILSLAGVVLASSYILGNPALALMGALTLVYYSIARIHFNPSLRVTRSIPSTGVEGKPIEARVSVENASEIGGVVLVRETSEKVSSEEVRVKIGPHEKKQLVQTLIPTSKGRIKPRAIATFRDELGLFESTFRVKYEGELTVLPSPENLKVALKEKKRKDVFSETGRALKLGMETFEFEELREFVPGDDVTRIDWKATSRLQELVVRVFLREGPAEVYLLINIDRRFRRELTGRKIDYLVLLLTQMLLYFRRLGHAVMLVAYDDGGIRLINKTNPLGAVQELGLEMERGIPPLRPLPDNLKSLKPSWPSKTSGILRASLKVTPGSYVIIVDDVGLHPRDILKAVEILRRRGSKTVVVYPNPLLFFDREKLGRDELEALYRAYRMRKELLRKLRGRVNIIEVGPKDLLPAVVRKL